MAFLGLLAMGMAACESDRSQLGASTSLVVAWTFDSGDCSSGGIETVRITWGPWEPGATGDDTVVFPCADGAGTVGFVEPGGTYFVAAAGLDAGGVARAENFPTGLELGDSLPSSVSMDVELHPKPVTVSVSWSVSGAGGCPWGYLLPYYVSLYEAAGGVPTKLVARTQVDCIDAATTLERVRPRDYVVEVESVTTTPWVHGERALTVVAGEDAAVHLNL
jgi:hypothetical protein